MVRQHIREEKIIDYVLGQLPNEEHFKINTHLSICMKCRNERDYWEKQLHVKTTIIPSSDLKQRIFTSLNLRKNRFNMRWVYVAVSLCVVFLVSFNYFQSLKLKINDEYSAQLSTQQHHIDLSEMKHFPGYTQNPSDTLSISSYMMNNPLWLVELYHFDNLYSNYIKTSTINRPSNTLFLAHNNLGQIFFVVDDNICSYELHSNQLSCSEIKLSPKNNKPLQIDSKIYYFKQ